MSRSLTRDPFNIFRPRFFVLFCGHLRYYSLTTWWSQKPSSRAWEVQNVYFFRKKPNDATISSYLSTKFQVEKLIRIFVSVGSSKWRLSHTQIIRKVFSLKSILFQKVNLCLQLIAFEILRWISWLCKDYEGKEKVSERNRWNMSIVSRYIFFTLKSFTEWQDAYNVFNIYPRSFPRNIKGNFLSIKLFVTLARGHARDCSVIVESHQEWLAWERSKGKH